MIKPILKKALSDNYSPEKRKEVPSIVKIVKQAICLKETKQK